jgi:hypothetical protein
MSKAGDFIDKVKRHQFWILCGVVAVVGLVSWWLATRSLADTYAKSKAKIDGEYGKIGSVRQIDPHPNDDWEKQLREIVEKDRKEVENAWKQLYNLQKSKVYVWPADVLGQEFVDEVEALRPGEELGDDKLDIYHNSVLKQFEKLAKLVDAEYEDPSQGSVFGRERQPVITQPLSAAQRKVIWYDQATVQKPYDWAERPTTKQVLYAQEEIWVLTAICEAIQAANAGSSGAHDAAVQIIEEMAVGYLAAEDYPNGEKEPGRVMRLKAPLASSSGGGYGYGGPPSGGGIGAEGGAEGGGGGGRLARPPRPDISASGGVQTGYGSTTAGSPGGPGGGAGDATAAPTESADYLNEWRYVDGKSKPLTAAELATPPFHEYRLMPWKVRMMVDQRKWDDLLVAFRNTVLPLSIRQVRVNPDTGPGGLDPRGSGGSRGEGSRGGYGAAGGGYGATRGGHTSGRGGYGAGYGGGSKVGYGAGAGGRVAELSGGGSSGTQGTLPTITLELRGVAYLVNPPDFSKIGVAGASAAASDSAATTSAAPVAAPAADAASGELSGIAPTTPAPAPAVQPAAGGGGRR